MQWTREPYLDLMTFRPVKRPMFVELFGPLIGLEAEWRAQGATDEQIELTAFDWDHTLRSYTGIKTGMVGGAEPVILSETQTHRVMRDGLGRTVMLDKRTATIPLPQDFPVKNMDDWLKLKPMFEYVESRKDERIDLELLKEAKQARDGGALVVAGIPGGFDLARELMGEEIACMAYYDQPELMQDILATIRNTAVRVLEEAVEHVTIDQLSVHEDFAGKSGPLIGPSQIAEYLQPYYRAAWSIVQSRGGRIFQLDTDGNINSVIDALLDCGLTSIYPMEPAAGMDIVKVRQKYGTRLAMLGGIDKFVLTKGRDAIRAQLEYKMQPMMRTGMVFGLDHRIPNGTPLDAYCYYVKTGREILGLPPLAPARQGWARAAF